MKEVKFRTYGEKGLQHRWLYSYDRFEKDEGDVECVFADIEFPTGLKDKNGVEIYDGDILTVINKEPFAVKYLESEACYMLENSSTRFALCSVDPMRLEIIGNIHENPELLEVRDGK